MKYFDEDLLEKKRILEHRSHNTFEDGLYAGEELITFSQLTLPNSVIQIPLPDQFIMMPDKVKNIKYPSKEAPEFIVTSLDSTVNFSFNNLPILLNDGDLKDMSYQFQTAILNINPAIVVKNSKDINTEQGNEMSWFEYKGYHLDGQSYNRICLIRMRKTVLHGSFNCDVKDRNNWTEIVEKIFLAVKEDV